MLACPMTSRIKGYPFEVVLGESPPGAILADQIKSLDWRARKAVFKGKASDAVVAAVSGLLATLITT